MQYCQLQKVCGGGVPGKVKTEEMEKKSFPYAAAECKCL